MANHRFTNTSDVVRYQHPKIGILFLKGKPVIVQGRREVILCKADGNLTDLVA